MRKTALRPASARQARELALRRKVKAELIAEHGAVDMDTGENPDWRGIELSHTVSLAQGGKTTKDNVKLKVSKAHSQRHGIREV